MNRYSFQKHITFDTVPPAHRQPLNALIALKEKKDCNIIPYRTVFYVFSGYRFSHSEAIVVLEELEELEVVENVLFKGIWLESREEVEK
jgi:hypothetical protein